MPSRSWNGAQNASLSQMAVSKLTLGTTPRGNHSTAEEARDVFGAEKALRPLVKLFPIELPPTRVAVSQHRETLKFAGVCIRVRQSVAILSNKSIDTRPKSLRLPAYARSSNSTTCMTFCSFACMRTPAVVTIPATVSFTGFIAARRRSNRAA